MKAEMRSAIAIRAAKRLGAAAMLRDVVAAAESVVAVAVAVAVTVTVVVVWCLKWFVSAVRSLRSSRVNGLRYPGM
jgi:hypothetical protein